MIPQDFIQQLLGARRYRRRDRQAREAEESRARTTRPAARFITKNRRRFSVSPDQAVLSLLRLRRARHRHFVPDGILGHGISRRGPGTCRKRRHDGAGRGESRRVASSARRKPRRLTRGAWRPRCNFYRRELKKRPKAIDYLKSRGLSGEIAAQLRPRLRAGRLAGPERRRSRITPPRR